MILILSILALLISILVAIVVYIKIKSVYINLYNLSKGMDILFANQDKILELSKLKSFIQLTNDETITINQELSKEKERVGKKATGNIRPLETNKDDKKS